VIEDGGNHKADIRQGVTLEVLCEGWSIWDEVTEASKKVIREFGYGNIAMILNWENLGEYLEFLPKKGVFPQCCLFCGGATTFTDLNTMGFETELLPIKKMEKMEKHGKKSNGRRRCIGIGSFIDLRSRAFLCKHRKI